MFMAFSISYPKFWRATILTDFGHAVMRTLDRKFAKRQRAAVRMFDRFVAVLRLLIKVAAILAGRRGVLGQVNPPKDDGIAVA